MVNFDAGHHCRRIKRDRLALLAGAQADAAWKKPQDKRFRGLSAAVANLLRTFRRRIIEASQDLTCVIQISASQARLSSNNAKNQRAAEDTKGVSRREWIRQGAEFLKHGALVDESKLPVPEPMLRGWRKARCTRKPSRQEDRICASK